MAFTVPQPASQPPRRRLVLRFAMFAALTVLVVAALALERRWRRGSNPSSTAVIHFAVGQRLVYQIDFDSASASNFGAVFSESPSALMSHLFDASFQGELVITVLEADADHVSLVYDFHHPQVRFQADGQDEPKQSQIIQAGLAQPVFCLLDGRGRVQSVWFDSAANPVAQQMIRTLLAAMQVVGPAEPDSPAQWEVEEENPNGRLIAHYQVQADGTIHKTTLRYLPPKLIKKTKTMQLIPTIQSAGEHIATLDAGGSLISLSAAEAQSMLFQNRIVGQGILKLDLRLLRKEQSPPGELAQLRAAGAQRSRAASPVPLYVVVSPVEGQQTIQREALGNATLESLLDELAVAEKQSSPEKDVTHLYLQFKALAIVRPASCAPLGKILTTATPGSLKMRILTDALEAAGNAEAQAALGAAILARTEDWKALQLLIPALGAAESPTPQTEETLLALAFGKYDNNVATAARLALGNAARNLADQAPARAVKIVDRLLEELSAQNSADSKWQLLLAIGNAGSTEALPTLTRLLDDPAPALRGAAAWALRWIDSPQADLLLTTKALVDDRDPAVRVEAVRALHFREKTPANVTAQEKALADEADANVRIELLGNLWEVRESYPDAKALVEKAAADDPASEVREAVARMMEKALPAR